MEGAFLVSIWPAGCPVPLECKGLFVVRTGCPHLSDGAEFSDSAGLQIAFAANRVLQSQTAEPSSVHPRDSSSGSCCMQTRETLVVHEDAGLHPSQGSEAWADLLTSLSDLKEASSISAVAARREWRASVVSPHHDRTPDCSKEAVLGSPDCLAAVSVPSGLPAIDPTWTDRLESLGPARAAYARRVCSVLSRLCRWRCPYAPVSSEHSASASSVFQSDQNLPSVSYPSAAFSLVFHSDTFGLLFFCRDKLGLASLLAVEQPPRRAVEGPLFALTPSAAMLRLAGRPALAVKGSRVHVTEVPVDGVWILDLWELADSLQEKRVLGSAVLPLGVASEEDPDAACLRSAAPSGGATAFCIPWAQPSVLRGDHLWCACTDCCTAREAFWQQHFGGCSQSSVLCGALRALGPSETQLETILWGPTKLSKAFSAADSPNISCSGAALFVGNATAPTSAEVLKCLYSQIIDAVSRALPEALGRINAHSDLDATSTAAAASPAFVGLLFSGGVDSTLLAGMVLRVLAAAMAAENPGRSPAAYPSEKAVPQQLVVVELVSVGFSAEAPDRMTALRSYEDLLQLLHCLGSPCRRGGASAEATQGPPNCSLVTIGEWGLELRLVAIDVGSADTAEHRTQLLEAIHPKRSHMDFNIAAPLYFASRGVGYLVSPSFGQSTEWRLLLRNSALWTDLLIRPPPHHRMRSQPARNGGASTQGDVLERETPVQGKKSPFRQSSEGRGRQWACDVSCGVCRRQAKEGCAHFACKLCCEKLRNVATQCAEAEGPDAMDNGEIYLNGRGKIKVSALGIAIQKTCPVHRRRQLRCTFTSTGTQSGQHSGCGTDVPGKAKVPAPFESLASLPCGVPLATTSSGRPFMAMHAAEASEWSSLDPRRQKCIDAETGTYILQSSVVLMGSGADELFGGYGRHRTANLKQGGEALRKEQILDLKRLWFRNMGRDARSLGAFGRLARFPFLDENLLCFVCKFVPFSHIVQPDRTLSREAEGLMQRLLATVDGQMQNLQQAGTSSCGTLHSEPGSGESLQGPGRELNARAEHLMSGSNSCKGEEGGSTLCCGNKWLLRLCAVLCRLPFSSVAKKRAMQFGSRSAKVSNSECFSSNRKARGDAVLHTSSDSQ
ncbi:uncharacterized protein LOC34620261 [Cyclospora cayetanensis]|uniref:Uncharacterized protein LOC34620261 n=1 Tax=Cyclospora cayetanensis TaxID=88456 RepID=A0A6P6RUB8_9EIME|nr:uncharacterized protein LOC34620261 [Cyclospora cayetanensis]